LAAIGCCIVSPVSDEVAWSRVEKTNERLRADLYIAPNTFNVLKPRFEPLDQDEARVEIEG
jgi:hypothetical protein